jgi:N-acetylglutamate synthase-like GNAT family acetyltransferase
MLIVDPAYHGRGAGRLLVKWGLEHADRLGVEASYVCSSVDSKLTCSGFRRRFRARSAFVPVRGLRGSVI